MTKDTGKKPKVKRTCKVCGDKTNCLYKRDAGYDKDMADMLGLNSMAERCKNFIPEEGIEYEPIKRTTKTENKMRISWIRSKPRELRNIIPDRFWHSHPELVRHVIDGKPVQITINVIEEEK